MRAPVSNVMYSNQQRIKNIAFSLLLEEAGDGEASEAARHSSERQAVMPPPTPEAGKSESGYSCGPGRSVPSMADFSDSELDPQDSISNKGPSPSDNGRNWPSQPVPGWCNVHGCYMSGEFFDPKYRAWVQVIQPRVRVMRAAYCQSSSYADCSVYQGFEACRCESLDPSALLALYSEERNTRQDSGDKDRCFHHDVYDDDFEEPFAPRPDSHGDSRRSSPNVDWDHGRDPGHDIEQDWEPSDFWLDEDIIKQKNSTTI